MEEGAFYESIECARSFDLPIVFFVENNEWSLASKISQRRKNRFKRIIIKSGCWLYVP